MQADQQMRRDYISNLAKSEGPFATHILRYISADSHFDELHKTQISCLSSLKGAAVARSVFLLKEPVGEQNKALPARLILADEDRGDAACA